MGMYYLHGLFINNVVWVNCRSRVSLCGLIHSILNLNRFFILISEVPMTFIGNRSECSISESELLVFGVFSSAGKVFWILYQVGGAHPRQLHSVIFGVSRDIAGYR